MSDPKFSAEDLQAIFDEVAGPAIADMRKQNEELSAEVKSLREAGVKTDLDKAIADYEADRRRKYGKDKSELGLGFSKFVRLAVAAKGDLDRAKAAAEKAGDFEGCELVEKSIEAGRRRAAAMAGIDTKAMGTDTFADGGAVVPAGETEEFIELLRDRTVFRRAGARSLPLNGTLPIPGMASGGTFSYNAENANVAHTAPTLRAINLVEKYAGGTVAVSNQLLRSSSPRADSFIREDMLLGVQLLEDITFLRSAGGSGKPTGVAHQMAAANKFSRTQAGAASTLDEITKDIAKLMRLVKTANIPMVRPGFVMTDRELIGLGTLRDSNGNTAFPGLVNGVEPGRLYGMPVYTTNQLPTDLGGGDESEVYFGDFAQAIIGDGMSVMIDASDTAAYHDGSAVQSAFSRNQTVFRVLISHDMGLRHTTAFSLCDTVDWGADLA